MRGSGRCPSRSKGQLAGHATGEANNVSGWSVSVVKSVSHKRHAVCGVVSQNRCSASVRSAPGALMKHRSIHRDTARRGQVQARQW